MTDKNVPENLLDLITSSTEVLYENAPCGYIFTRPDGSFVKVNRTFLTWTGYSESELLEKKKFQQILSIGSRIYYETNYGPLLQMQGFLSEILLDLETQSHSLKPVLINSAEMRDSRGDVVLIKSTLFDITERRQYERELLLAKRKAEEATIRATFLAKAGFYLRESSDLKVELKKIAELATHEFCDGCAIDLKSHEGPVRVAGHHRISEKTIPQFPFLLTDQLYITDTHHGKSLEPALEKVLDHLEPQSLIITPIHRAGEVLGQISFFITELGKRFSPEDANLATELAFSVCGAMERIELQTAKQKIAEDLRESHEWFSTTLASIGDAVIAINPNKTVDYLNAVAEELTGWKLSEARGVSMDKVFHIINATTGMPAFNPVEVVLRENRIVELMNNTALIRKDGSSIIIEDSASPIKGNDGLVKGVVLVFRDTTQKHLEETQKSKLLSTLKSEKEIREKFVATLTHDLRSPLTSVKINIQMMQKKMAGDQLTSFATRALNSINRADRMIRDLLDANRLRAGEKIPLEMREFDFVALTRSVLSELSLIHGERFQLEAPSSVTGRGNEDAIIRILENLCNNAVKYGSSETPVKLAILDESERLILKVQNTGKPIPEAALPTLFEPYKRLETEETAEHNGWGLGLTLVKGFTESHGGSVDVESSLEKGTIFRVILPRC